MIASNADCRLRVGRPILRESLDAGARLATVARLIRLSAGITIGPNTWYVAPGRVANGVLRVRKGIIEEIGIADRALTVNRHRARTFLASFG